MICFLLECLLCIILHVFAAVSSISCHFLVFFLRGASFAYVFFVTAAISVLVCYQLLTLSAMICRTIHAPTLLPLSNDVLRLTTQNKPGGTWTCTLEAAFIQYFPAKAPVLRPWRRSALSVMGHSTSTSTHLSTGTRQSSRESSPAATRAVPGKGLVQRLVTAPSIEGAAYLRGNSVGPHDVPSTHLQNW